MLEQINDHVGFSHSAALAVSSEPCDAIANRANRVTRSEELEKNLFTVSVYDKIPLE